MGIELPRQLADVAAQAGVAWPEADEERMRQAAQAWRDAGTKMSNLARDADGTARTALNAVEGNTGDAARRHWSTFVAPDTGHLTASARGCTAAADRLDHAANQVGAAKVEIVRNLVALAQNRDAANQAASAGYPEALAGLDTAVRGTAANVANIQTSLVSAVQPATGVDIADVQNPVNANPGTHGPGPLDPVNTVVGEVTRDVADTGGQVIDDAGQTVDRATQDVGSGAPSPIGSGGDVRPLPLPVDGGGGAPGVPVPLPGDGVVPLPGDGGGSEPGEPGVGNPAPPPDPDNPNGLVGIEPAPDPYGGGQWGPGVGVPGVIEPGVIGDPNEVPTPPTGTPNQTVQAGLAGPVLDAPAQGPAAAAPGAAGPGPGGAAPAPGGGAQGPGFAAPPGGGPLAGGPPPAGAAPGGQPGAGAGAAVPPPRPGDRGVMRFDAVAPAGEPPRGGKPGWTAAVPPGPPAATQSGTGAPGPAGKAERDQAVALFWVHMFPIGHMPVADDRPARQLTPPRVEIDYAAGMRFEPGDHPDSALVDGADRLAALREGAERIEHADGLHSDDPRVSELLDGHDPLGGDNERDWDRRYLVRLGSVTARGITRKGMEFAWPPAERYPEGGTAPGEPEILAEGTVIDRFGPVEGRVFAAGRTAFAQRSLPPFQADSGYRRYEVLRPLPVWRAVSAAWFAQPGGGVRYRATHPVADLVALGYLADITEGTDE